MPRAIAGVFLTLFVCGAQGQTGGTIEFEVASVKLTPPSEPGRIRMGFRGGPGTADPTRLTVDGYPIFLLIMRAYDVSRSRYREA